MENNILEMLSGLLGKNNQTQQQDTQPQSQVLSYPKEAYPEGYTPQNTPQNGILGNNSLLPLLLSMMGQNSGGQLGALAKLFSGGDAGAMANLFKSGKDSPEKDASATPPAPTGEQPAPTDDVIL